MLIQQLASWSMQFNTEKKLALGNIKSTSIHILFGHDYSNAKPQLLFSPTLHLMKKMHLPVRNSSD